MLAGMSANLCVESHVRDAAENGFDGIVVKDATAGAGEDATHAAHINFGFIASDVVTADEIVRAHLGQGHAVDPVRVIRGQRVADREPGVVADHGEPPVAERIHQRDLTIVELLRQIV
jgi:hypothetical protein